jgi:hypothetical protein
MGTAVTPRPLGAQEIDLAIERVVAVGLLTGRDVARLGPTFTRIWRVEDTPCFSQLLQAIDEADREIRRAPHKHAVEPE